MKYIYIFKILILHINILILSKNVLYTSIYINVLNTDWLGHHVLFIIKYVGKKYISKTQSN